MWRSPALEKEKEEQGMGESKGENTRMVESERKRGKRFVATLWVSSSVIRVETDGYWATWDMARD